MSTAETKNQKLERLFAENGLIPEDWFIHSQYRIITRSGIEKIQGKNKIEVRFDAVMMSPQFCVVKAIATKEGARIETFGSAGFQADGSFPKGKGFQYLYFPEIAEKRALSRAVLKTMGFYELGVFGEDEADDFKQGSQRPNPELAQAVAEMVAATSRAEMGNVWRAYPHLQGQPAFEDAAHAAGLKYPKETAASIQHDADQAAFEVYDQERGHG